jgi:gliding motility-associated-like protein
VITVGPSVTTTYYVTGSEGCSPDVYDSVKVTMRNPLFLSAVKDTILCHGEKMSVSLLDSGGLASNRKIVWDSIGLVGNSVVVNPLAVGKTLYHVHVEDGCTVLNDTSIFTVDRLPAITGSIALSDSILCYGDLTTVQITVGGGRSLTMSWFLDGVQISALSVLDTPLLSKTYRLVVSDGCSIPYSDSVKVVVAPSKINLSLGTHDSSICAGSSVGYLSVNGTGGFAPLTYQWDDPMKQTTAKATGLGKGIYVLRVKDAQGCLDSLGLFINEFRLRMNPLRDPELVRIPNLITPNGDIDNEYWDLTELFEYNKRLVNIYNRAGELVYHSDAYQNDWNGKDASGAELPVGIYFYHMKHNKTGEEHRGFIQIMR